MRVRIGSLLRRLPSPRAAMPTARAHPGAAERGNRSPRRFDPCVILLNNDLSAGYGRPAKPEQTVLPPLFAAGPRAQIAALRRLRPHCRRLRQLLNITVADQPVFRHLRQGGFPAAHRHGLPRPQVDTILQKTRAKYADYGVKADLSSSSRRCGTYGMGIMT